MNRLSELASFECRCGRVRRPGLGPGGVVVTGGSVSAAQHPAAVWGAIARSAVISLSVCLYFFLFPMCESQGVENNNNKTK